MYFDKYSYSDIKKATKFQPGNQRFAKLTLEEKDSIEEELHNNNRITFRDLQHKLSNDFETVYLGQ